MWKGFKASRMSSLLWVPLFDIGNSIHLQEGHPHGLPWIPCLSQKGPSASDTSSGSMMGRSTSCASSSPPSWPSSIPQSSLLLLPVRWGPSPSGPAPWPECWHHRAQHAKKQAHQTWGRQAWASMKGRSYHRHRACLCHSCIGHYPPLGFGRWNMETFLFVIEIVASITVKQRTKGHLMKFIIINQPIHHNCVFGVGCFQSLMLNPFVTPNSI